MNYLAHAYLSFNQPAIVAGNMISDFIKGKKQLDYPDDIRKGITLHRAIDAFTDDHAVTKEAKEIFRPHYRLYSYAFMDVVYDHFLANDKLHFSEDALFRFSQEVYAILENYQPQLPESFRLMFPYMKQHNWLYNYRNRTGIERSFEGLARRAMYIKESKTAFTLFESNYAQLQQYYARFFPALHEFAFNKLQELNLH
jgi:acyl carrier protein phosphodiesterase